MLKKRLVGCLVIKGGITVQSVRFCTYLPIGNPLIAAEYLSSWGIDEIVLFDIEARRKDNGPNVDLTTQVSKRIFVPLTVGGGIRSLDDIRRLIHGGADKVSLNSVVLEHPEIITSAAQIFGAQCVVVSIDARKNKYGKYEVFTQGGKMSTGKDPSSFAKKIETLGAGEIFLTSIERDGTKSGYDIELVRQVVRAVTIPVVICGGAGHPRHFLEGLLNGKASAVAACNTFHFTEHSPIVIKSFLKQHDIEVRLDTYAGYEWADFQRSGRIAKRSEDELYKLRFEYQPKEVI